MSTKNLILTIDEGTTNTKALILNAEGHTIAQASRPVDIHFPQPGWVEQDAAAIWASVVEVVTECLQNQHIDSGQLAGIGLSNQRESGIAWDRYSGKPLGPLVSWQCRRSADFCTQLRTPEHKHLVYKCTGLALDPMFTASKFRWLLDHIPHGHARAEAGEVCLGTVDSWLVWNFSGGTVHATDVTNASRTQLYNIHRREWDAELLHLFGIPRAALPEVKESSSVFGETVSFGLLPHGVPIASVIGDSHAALFGHAGFQAGAVKATFGTGSSLMMPTSQPRFSQTGLSTTIAWGYGGIVYALEGNIYVTGATVQWLGDLLGLSPAQIAEKAATVNDTGGMYLVPAFVGLGAPYWNSEAKGLITGLTRGSSSNHMARAAIESIAYQIRDIFDLMEVESGTPLQVLLADGGPTRNDMLIQFQADIIGRPVIRTNATNLSALGAGYLAGLTVKMWNSYADISALPRAADRFEPHMAETQREGLYAGWREAVARTLFKPI